MVEKNISFTFSESRRLRENGPCIRKFNFCVIFISFSNFNLLFWLQSAEVKLLPDLNPNLSLWLENCTLGWYLTRNNYKIWGKWDIKFDIRKLDLKFFFWTSHLSLLCNDSKFSLSVWENWSETCSTWL